MEQTKKTNIVRNLMFVFLSLVLVLVVVFSLNDIEEIFIALKGANLLLVIVAMGLVLLHMLTTNLALHFITTGLGIKFHMIDSMAIGSAEYFFNAITPFSSGGQPFQAYFYMKKGIKGDSAVAILMSNFIVYQVVMTTLSTVGLILFYDRVKAVLDHYLYLILIGYIMNLSILVLLILLSTIPSVEKLFNWVLKTLGKIKFLSRPMEKAQRKTGAFVENFQVSMGLLFKRKRVLIGATLLRVFGLILLNATPYVIFLALGVNLSPDEIVFVISMTLFASTFMLWVPTPGASGGTEWAFTVIFSSLITGATAVLVTSMLLWRFVTYYFGMLIGFIAYIVLRKRGI
ncbi:MAG: flippase-like domain-containing protein [Acholeplasma sp.]|nr:flippase-like domain-containing protein [Acholeplasma sp.]